MKRHSIYNTISDSITYNNFFIIMPSNRLITWHPPFYGAFFMYSAFSEPNKYRLYTK